MMVGYIVAIGVIMLMAVVGIVIAWYRGYAAGRWDGLVDQNCRMGQAARVIKKELDWATSGPWATNWSARDSLHDISDLED